jgi:hypothetical protein
VLGCEPPRGARSYTGTHVLNLEKKGSKKEEKGLNKKE